MATLTPTWVHLVGPHAEQVIDLFALAMRQGLRVNQFLGAVFAYPTAASDVVLHARQSQRSGGQRESVHLPAGRDHGAPQA